MAIPDLCPRLLASRAKKAVPPISAKVRNRWPAVHRRDAARLFRLALEKGVAGARYHGVADEGIPFRSIAEVIGGRLNVPVGSISNKEAAKQFSFLAGFVATDNPSTSNRTREQLGWEPTGPGLLADLNGPGYFAAK